MTKRKLYRAILDKYGITAQSLMVSEECAELVKAVSKLCREVATVACSRDYTTLTRNLAEEIADVQIMCEQMMSYYRLSKSEVNTIYEQKLERLEKRLND